MIEDLLIWVALVNPQDLNSLTKINPLTTKSLSTLTFILYLLSIKKSYLFGAAFLLCEVLVICGIVPTELEAPIYGLSFYSVYIVAWLSISSIHILGTRNKNTLLSCVTMIIFLLIMAWDSYINAYTETFIYEYYEVFVVCLHCCIIASLYWYRFIFNGVVGDIKRIFSVFRYNVCYLYIWYTVRKID